MNAQPFSPAIAGRLNELAVEINHVGHIQVGTTLMHSMKRLVIEIFEPNNTTDRPNMILSCSNDAEMLSTMDALKTIHEKRSKSHAAQ